MNIICVLLGTVIGAGFISGTEINLFFNSMGMTGLVGLVISGVLLGICIFLSLESKCSSYAELLNKNIENKIIIKIFSSTINLFLIVSFFIMIAGLSSFLFEEFNINYSIASLVSILLSFIIIRGNISRIEVFNKIFVPVLIFLILILMIFVDLKNINFQSNIVSGGSFAILGITYASYNAISLIPVAIKLKREEDDRKKNKLISIIFAMITIIAGCIIFLLLETNMSAINYEIPMLEIVNKGNNIIQILVKGSIVFSILSTAISVQYAAINNFSFLSERTNIKAIILMDIVAVIMSGFGFKNLITIFYPLFGVIGIFNYIVLIKNYIKCSKMDAKY